MKLARLAESFQTKGLGSRVGRRVRRNIPRDSRSEAKVPIATFETISLFRTAGVWRQHAFMQLQDANPPEGGSRMLRWHLASDLRVARYPPHPRPREILALVELSASLQVFRRPCFLKTVQGCSSASEISI